ncbi:sugar dehydrogenase complex small subunit [Govanella unica]|uniref:Sorbitol dehydrogenase family protein n=1 Tax=Govanella unica TaxID=2975056 RepID=A0A9X3TZQ6_9PROT|nr:sugar dehydrogenase complex small subunit [Govania unica]MDA5194452.1 sorbitol dehydrogenase family protein [Govania unica]
MMSLDVFSAAANHEDLADPARRHLLVGLLTAYTASLIPWALAQAAPSAEHGAFTALSAILVGRQALDTTEANRLYDALAIDPHFPTDVQALLTLINERHIAPLQLQATLDSGHSPLAPLPRKIVSAWALGVVGSGENARCVAYESALNAVIVADVLKPPTYAYGAYGSWIDKPL